MALNTTYAVLQRVGDYDDYWFSRAHTRKDFYDISSVYSARLKAHKRSAELRRPDRTHTLAREQQQQRQQ